MLFKKKKNIKLFFYLFLKCLGETDFRHSVLDYFLLKVLASKNYAWGQRDQLPKKRRAVVIFIISANHSVIFSVND